MRVVAENVVKDTHTVTPQTDRQTGNGLPQTAIILLIPLFCCLVARGGRKRGNRQIDRQTYGRTDQPSLRAARVKNQ